MSETPQAGSNLALREPGQRQEPRFDPAGEYAALMRDRARDSEATLAEAKRQLAEAETVASERVKAAERAGQDRLIRAELKAFGLAAGIVDVDVLRLIDLKSSGVKLDESGEVVRAKEAVEALKAAKPWAFKQNAAEQGSSSSAAAAPGTAPAAGKVARDMTDSEWRAARARLISQ